MTLPRDPAANASSCGPDPEVVQRLWAQWGDRVVVGMALLQDEAGTVVDVRGAETVLGHEVPDLIGRPADILFPPQDREAGAEAGERRLATSLGSIVSDRWLVRDDGSRVWTVGGVAAVRQAGRCIGHVRWFHERDDLRAELASAQARITSLEADRQRLSGALDAAIHDLANPLAPLTTALGMLASAPPERLEGLVAVIERQVAQMKRLLDGLRRMQQSGRRPERLRAETFALLPLLQRLKQTATLTAQERSQTVEVLALSPDIELQADPEGLHQLLVPLVDNALCFSPAGATVWVVASADDQEVQVRICDRGLGMEGATQSQLRGWLAAPGDEPPPPAVGQGLTLARHWARLHGGVVQVRSAGPDQGSEFTLRMPRRRALPPTGAPGTPGPSG